LDCAINNAGIEIEKDFPDYTEEDWNRTIDINLKGVRLCMMHEIPEMLKQGKGSIVNISL
jgi:NAD(P)-dependent dehydrogenase (short-subunit alcohol dehydrogenase family)